MTDHTELLRELTTRMDDIRSDLLNHAYGLDEWSPPVVNLTAAIDRTRAILEQDQPEPEQGGECCVCKHPLNLDPTWCRQCGKPIRIANKEDVG